MQSGEGNSHPGKKCMQQKRKIPSQFEAEVIHLEQLAKKKQQQLKEQAHDCDKERKHMEIQSKRQQQAEAEVNRLEQLAKKKQNQFQRRSKKLNSNLEQQARDTQLIEHAKGNKLINVQNKLTNLSSKPIIHS